MALKKYVLDKSPLYRLGTKQKLAAILDISTKELTSLQRDTLYKVWEKSTGQKKREIQEPIGIRKAIHLRIHDLLSRIQTPAFLYSGQKRVSCIDNAKHHIGNHYFLCTDISEFYRNCKREYIFRFFHRKMKMADDIAWILTDIITYNGHIPTGSHLSQDLAYWANHDTFEQIGKIATCSGITFTLYVDDMTLSSTKPISPTMHLTINYHLSKVGLHLKRKKTRYLSKNQYKRVTGAIVSPSNELLIPNKHMKEIAQLREEAVSPDKRASDPQNGNPLRLLGKLRYVRQIQPSFHDNVYRSAKVIERQIQNEVNAA